ncbi:MAG TPA: penicillin acylase family protein, partial [Burkholderiaceae bacterium]|nr:penicillin acylase family protein [Burkholderiaceae bacterium]
MRKSRVRVWSGRIALGAAGLVAASALGVWLYLRGSMAQLDGELHAPVLHAQVSVARDAHGVPLISGADRLDVAYATGFVHAQDRYFQMDLLRRVAAGELSELFGARALGVDRAHRLHRFRARAALAVQAMPAAQRALLDRYVGGVNAGLEGLRTRPFEYALIGMAPRPWSPEDTLLVIWAMYFDLQGGQEPRELARGWLMEHTDAAQRAFLAPPSSLWDAPLDAERLAVADAPIPAAPPVWWGKRRAPNAPRTASAAFIDMVGSNNWAVAGSRSTDGGAIVSDDMHLGIQLPNTWYRAALQFPDGAGGQRRVVGVTLPGTPAVVVGSNGRVAWGFTNSYGDYLDLIALDTDPAHAGQVRTQAGWETPVAHEETILVKGAPADKLVVRETSLGPIRDVAGRQYAVHWAAHTAAAVNFNALQLEAADSVQQALAIAP